MGNAKAAFESIGYAIVLLAITVVAAPFIGLLKELSPLFSSLGFFIYFFIIFTSIAK